MNGSKREQIIVLGLDSAPPHLIFRWANEGKLPNLQGLIKEGVSGELRTVLPPITPSAWASFMTGKNPGKHGVFEFDIRADGSYRRIPTNSTNIKAQTLWRILSDFGKTVGVVHVPMTVPPEPVNGFVVGDHAVANYLDTYPAELKTELLDAIPDYNEIFNKLLSVMYIPGFEREYISNVEFFLAKEAKATTYLLKRYDPDFFISHFYWGDQIQHFFWKFMDESHPQYVPALGTLYGNTILSYYQKIDSLIGEILKTAQDATIMIISDHGAGPSYKQVFVNHWLYNMGLLKLKEKPKSIKRSIMRHLGLTTGGLERIVGSRLLKHLTLKVPRPVARWVMSQVPSSNPKHDDIDYSNTQAYSTGEMGQIFINLEGREPNGMVKKADYGKFREHVIGQLSSLRDPETGDPLISAVYKAEEIYSGPYVERAPDILFELKGMSYLVKERYELQAPPGLDFSDHWNQLTGPPGSLTGWHRINGLWICCGPGIRKGTIVDARIIDLMPTLLHMMRVPIPDDVDGRVLFEMFVPNCSHAVTKPIFQTFQFAGRPTYEYSKEEEKKIKDRLKALGYE